jgi:hypothetical protein
MPDVAAYSIPSVVRVEWTGSLPVKGPRALANSRGTIGSSFDLSGSLPCFMCEYLDATSGDLGVHPWRCPWCNGRATHSIPQLRTRGERKHLPPLCILSYFIFPACAPIARPSSLYLSSAVTGSFLTSYYNYWPSAGDELNSAVSPSCLVSFFLLPLSVSFFNENRSIFLLYPVPSATFEG